MERRVFIGASDRLLKGGQQIVMLITVPIVAHIASLGKFGGESLGYFSVIGGKYAKFNGVKGFTHVSAAALGNLLKNSFLNVHFFPRFFKCKLEAPFNGGLYLFGSKRLKLENGGAG